MDAPLTRKLYTSLLCSHFEQTWWQHRHLLLNGGLIYTSSHRKYPQSWQESKVNQGLSGVCASLSETRKLWKSRWAAFNTSSDTTIPPWDLTHSIHSFTTIEAFSLFLPSEVSGAAHSFARYHNNLSKLELIRISIAGDNVSFTPSSTGSTRSPPCPWALEKGCFSYRPVRKTRSRISFSLVATTNFEIGSPIFWA